MSKATRAAAPLRAEAGDLTVGRKGDAWERQADRAADGAISGGRPQIGRMGAEPGGPAAPPSVKAALARGGAPLDSPLRREMEQRFGRDFSQVRVQSDAASARDLRAHAYAAGRHIVFGDGQFAPHTARGQRLLAHELAHVVQQGARAEPSVVQCEPDDASPATAAPPAKEDSARFDDDKTLDDVTSGASTLKKGATGLAVTKLQRALLELKLMDVVTGYFGDVTEGALKKFQKGVPLPQSGELNKDTLKALHDVFDTRKPYIDNATLDPAKPGTHALGPTEQKQAFDALVPQPKTGAPSTFDKDPKYATEIEAALTKMIADFHKDLVEDKEPLRADPAKNFHGWPTLEKPAEAAKDVVDALYGSYYGGGGAKPALTSAGGNLIDQWTDEISRNAGLGDPAKKRKAQGKVRYLIDSNCGAINRAHSAVPSNTDEKAMLDPIVEKLTDTPAKVQVMLDLEMGWEGASLDGKVYLQQYKSTDPDAAKAKEANRVQMWSLFQTCIHEYIHTLAHKDFNTWAGNLKAAGDNTRYNTLTEGFCDFFTLNARKTIDFTKVQAKVEGPYANGNPPAPDTSDVYDSNVQAEQVVAIVGIKNAQAAYFGGKVELIGKV